MPKINPESRFRTMFKSIEPPEKRSPVLPVKISEYALDELGDLQIRYAAWREFAEDRHIEALADHMRAKEEYDLKYNQLYLTSQADQVTDKKKEAEASHDLQPLSQRLTDTEIYLKMMSGKLETFSNALSVISRELTRRGIIP